MDTEYEVFNEQYDMDDTIPYYEIYKYVDLTRALLEEINDLRDEVIRWRQVLTKYLPPEWAEGLRQDILNNLCQSFEDYSAYRDYVEHYCKGVDPLDNKDRCRTIKRLIAGTDETSIDYL